MAYSTFRETGYAVDDGIQPTKQLRSLFTSKFGRERRGFLLGHSLGGQIVEAIAEEHGAQYDGAVSLCGVALRRPGRDGHGGAVHRAQLRTMFDFF